METSRSCSGGARACTAALLALVSACKPALTPAEQARRDAADVARVEAAQLRAAPPRPLRLQGLRSADLARLDLSGVLCTFAPLAGGNPLLVANPQRGAVRFDDDLLALAVDPGTDASRHHFVGKTHTVTVVPAGAGALAGDHAVRWPAGLAVADADGRVVATAAGWLECGI